MSDELEEIKKKVVPILKKAGVKRSSIFGSYVRGDFNKKSDVDILIDPPKGFSLFDMGGLKVDLEEVLGKKVDLVTYKGVHPYVKEYVERDQLQIL